MIEELKELKRLTPSAGFKDAVRARLPVPPERRPAWPVWLSAAAGLLVGILGTVALMRPGPTPTTPPRLQAALRDHADRARKFLKQADTELIEADYQISGLGPRTRDLLAEPQDLLPESERQYVNVVARPMDEVGRFLEEGRRAEAVAKIHWLRAQVDFNLALESVEPADPVPVVAIQTASLKEGEAQEYFQARSLYYERAYGPATIRLGSFARRHPKSDLADRALYWAAQSALQDGQIDAAVHYFVQVAPMIQQDDVEALQSFRMDGNQMIVIEGIPTTVGTAVTSLTEFQVSSTDGQLVINGTFPDDTWQVLVALNRADPQAVELESPRCAKLHPGHIWRLRQDERYDEDVDLLFRRFPYAGVRPER